MIIIFIEMSSKDNLSILLIDNCNIPGYGFGIDVWFSIYLKKQTQHEWPSIGTSAAFLYQIPHILLQ